VHQRELGRGGISLLGLIMIKNKEVIINFIGDLEAKGYVFKLDGEWTLVSPLLSPTDLSRFIKFDGNVLAECVRNRGI